MSNDCIFRAEVGVLNVSCGKGHLEEVCGDVKLIEGFQGVQWRPTPGRSNRRIQAMIPFEKEEKEEEDDE